MKSHGFVEDPQQGWIPDYALLVARATPVLGSCIDEFGQEVGKSPELLMQFFQAMPFKLIADQGTGWTTGGVRVPSSVLLQGEGDCDSKALTFCVLHRRYSKGLAIFRTFRKKGNLTPGHVLLGLELYSSAPIWGKEWPRVLLEAGFYEDPIVVNNRYFIPCEVAGPDRVPYGTVALRKDDARVPISKDDYVVIPIPSP